MATQRSPWRIWSTPASSRGKIIAGRPADVAEQIIAQSRRTGSANIIGFFAGNRADKASVQASYRMFGAEVIPTLLRAKAS
jgi:alkanesulfonate monooxygenase SsuD/methylene tetrahydromethanopterin reductase-like flavin-dependent oxidoreductase (luciferase family)